jgi:hypothetical protein
MKNLLIAALLGLCAGCATMNDTSDFDRHRYSQLVMPYDRPDLLFFDVTLTPGWPDDDDAAEQQRMRWLAGWLRTRGACPDGFEILERRPFGFLEDNPRRHDLRYVLRCKPAAGG